MSKIKSFYLQSENSIAVLLAMLIFSLLITSSFLINTFYTNLFVYLLLSCIFIVSASFFIFNKPTISFSRNTIISIGLVFLWIIYILINDFFINTNGEKLKSNYIIVSLLLYVSLIFLFSIHPSLKKYIFIFLSVLAFIECSYCILQVLNVIKSDTAIKVTGTWVNPNITAMFLALVFPFALSSILVTVNKQKKLYILLICFIIISLLLLKCRTAILGALLASALILEWRYKICKNFITKQSKTSVYLATFAFIFLTTAISIVTYFAKKDSADGRKLIWNLSLKMVSQKPFFGFGYGNFERDYNLEQAKYFSNNANSENEIANASHTEMAYNEIIENAVDGGILGSAFVLGFIITLLNNGSVFFKSIANSIDNNSEIQIIISSITSIIVLLFMSLVNFTITATPIMCIFILFASVISSSKIAVVVPVAIPLLVKKAIPLTFILIGSVLFYTNLSTAFYQRKITYAINYAKDKEYVAAFSILETIPVKHQKNVNFYQTLSNAYYLNNQKEKALEVYKKSSLLYSSPLLYQQMGDCFFTQKDYANAIKNYETAKNIQPNRFTPRYLLLKVYIEQKDKTNAVKYANEIVALNEKIPSYTTNSIKKIAQEFLKIVNKKNG
jgi:O-antigen polymerase